MYKVIFYQENSGEVNTDVIGFSFKTVGECVDAIISYMWKKTKGKRFLLSLDFNDIVRQALFNECWPRSYWYDLGDGRAESLFHFEIDINYYS